ncbi:hypothetical protein BB934_45685 (plasmid) [Microvirga ossetica]|uniref:Uncharacterized protein n=1 Tax=Microvirga ossetica TaxID=1882682 RepID=A0A1B2F040_9HYPH|nr:hypothetical protein [Microvirga ossetica]ANY85513.1 hypothetical protein BB934_45685 [Microvirga ossetica]
MPANAVMVILNVDDPNGRQLTEMLMANADWQPHRDPGEIPFTRGLAMRDGIQDLIGALDPYEAEKLQSMAGFGVVMMDRGVVAVFAAEEVSA